MLVSVRSKLAHSSLLSPWLAHLRWTVLGCLCRPIHICEDSIHLVSASFSWTCKSDEDFANQVWRSNLYLLNGGRPVGLGESPSTGHFTFHLSHLSQPTNYNSWILQDTQIYNVYIWQWQLLHYSRIWLSTSAQGKIQIDICLETLVLLLNNFHPKNGMTNHIGTLHDTVWYQGA